MDVTKRAPYQRAASSKAHGGIDVLRESMTIASACMNHFRTNHLKENHLALFRRKATIMLIIRAALLSNL